MLTHTTIHEPIHVNHRQFVSGRVDFGGVGRLKLVGGVATNRSATNYPISCGDFPFGQCVRSPFPFEDCAKPIPLLTSATNKSPGSFMFIFMINNTLIS